MNNKHLTIEIIRTLESLLQKEYQPLESENVIINRLGFNSKQEEEIRNKILTLIKTL